MTRRARRVMGLVLGVWLVWAAGGSAVVQAASPAYDYVWPTYNGLAQFEQDGLIGLLDEDGNVVRPAEYITIMHHGTQGRMLAWGPHSLSFLSPAGEEMLRAWGQWYSMTLYSYQYEEEADGALYFENDAYNALAPGPYGEFLTVEADGYAPLDNLHDWDTHFANGNAFLYNDETGAHQLYAPNREPVCDEVWYWVFPLGNDTAWVRDDDLSRIIDAMGNTVVDLSHLTVWSTFHEGLLAAKVKDTQLYGYIDASGAFAIDPVWEQADDFAQGVAFVRRDRLYGLIDSSGAVLAEPQWEAHGIYEHIGEFVGGFEPVQKDGLWGFIDKQGNLTHAYRWAYVCAFQDGFAAVRDEAGLWGFVGAQGQVIPPQWREAGNFYDGRARVWRADTPSQEALYIDTTGALIAQELVDAWLNPPEDANTGLPRIDDCVAHGRELAWIRYQETDGEMRLDGTVISGIKGVERFEGVGW